jgi:benzoate membrane transport protein
LSGISGWFERIMDRVPLPIAAAMLAGILFQFGVDAFLALESRFGLVLIMFAVYLAAKKLLPRYTILIVLAVGFMLCLFQGLLDFSGFGAALDPPQYVAPEFSWRALISVGVPLFVVTMVSQNIPGIAVLRTAGYNAPISPLISWTGITTLLLAPFGGFAINLAAITAAIAGIFYLLLGIGGSAIAALFGAFPVEFIFALAGLALLSTIANSLYTAVADSGTREAAVITFVVTASGLSLFGIGAAFWGLVAGVIATLVLNKKS